MHRKWRCHKENWQNHGSRTKGVNCSNLSGAILAKQTPKKKQLDIDRQPKRRH
jgi:hypothetical protein